MAQRFRVKISKMSASVERFECEAPLAPAASWLIWGVVMIVAGLYGSVADVTRRPA
jgi:hypothetical protein